MKLNNGKYKLERTDDLNVCLFKQVGVKSKKTGEVNQKYKIIGYYRNLKFALLGYLDEIRKVATLDGKTIKDFILGAIDKELEKGN